jgi:hypothetical protein
MWLREGVPIDRPDAFMGGGEFGHFHRWDLSTHVILSDGQRSIRCGGRVGRGPSGPSLNGLPENRLMVYGPGDLPRRSRLQPTAQGIPLCRWAREQAAQDHHINSSPLG